MKPNTVVYTSNTGYTRQYAMLLSKKTGLPACSLDEAMKHLAPGSSVIYLGWLMAGNALPGALDTAEGRTGAVRST